MIALICFIWSVVTARFKSKSQLEAENAALRHKLVVLQRKVRGRIEFTNGDRLFFVLAWFSMKSPTTSAKFPDGTSRWGSMPSLALLRMTLALLRTASRSEQRITCSWPLASLYG